MFETFNVSAVCVANHAVMALHGTGRTTGLVVDCGDAVCRVVPVHEGHVHPPRHDTLGSPVLRFDHGGRDIMEHLMRISSGYLYSTPAERDLVRMIKEEMAYIALDFEEEMKVPTSDIQRDFELPNMAGPLMFGNERFRCTELLFQPDIIGSKSQGIHNVVHNSIMSCEAGIRDEMFANVLLTGGASMLSGFAERLQKELKCFVAPHVKVQVLSPPERKHLSWIGGSIFAGGANSSVWISKEEYDDVGPSVVNKCI